LGLRKSGALMTQLLEFQPLPPSAEAHCFPRPEMENLDISFLDGTFFNLTANLNPKRSAHVHVIERLRVVHGTFEAYQDRHAQFYSTLFNHNLRYFLHLMIFFTFAGYPTNFPTCSIRRSIRMRPRGGIRRVRVTCNANEHGPGRRIWMDHGAVQGKLHSTYETLPDRLLIFSPRNTLYGRTTI
jgi:hypothetical protein